MNLSEARQILKSHGYVMPAEREYTDDEAVKIWDALVELKNEYEGKGYTVRLIPTQKVGYYANIGYDPTIGTDYYSPRTAEQYAYRKDVFKDGIKNIVKDGEVPGKFLLCINKEPTEEYREYLKRRGVSSYFHTFEICIGFELLNGSVGDALHWKIKKEYHDGTVDEFISMVKQNVSDAERACKEHNYQNLKSNLPGVSRDAEKKAQKLNKKRKYDRVKELLLDDPLDNFDLCREIDEDALNKVMMDHLVGVIDEYVHDEYNDENGNVTWWDDDDDAWGCFDDDFCKFIDDDYDGDFHKFCEENELIEDGQFNWDYFNEWLDEWDWDKPSEPDNNPY
jgi:hypothetical protein